MIYRHLLTCLLFGLVSLNALGQDTLSLPQLWKEALDNYPSIEAYEANLQKAHHNKQLVRNQYLPKLQLQLQNTFGSQEAVGGAFFPLPGIYNIGGGTDFANPAANMFGSIVMDWKFFQFGKQKKSVEAAAVVTQQASYRLEIEKLAIQANLSSAYFQHLFNQQMQEWAQRSTKRLKSLFDASQSLAQAGLNPGADSLLVKASLKQSEATLDNWKGYQEETLVALATWINKPAGQFDVKDNFFFTTPGAKAGESVHPRLAFKQEQVNYAGKMKELAGLKSRPTLSLLGGVQVRGSAAQGQFYNAWTNSYSNPTGNYLVGLGLSWNLSAIFDTKTEKEKLQEEIYQREAEAETVALNLQSQEAIARQHLARSRQQIENAEQAYTAANEAYHLFETRYESGLISVSELLQIQDIVQAAEKTRIEAYYQYWIQQVELAESSADFSILQKAFN